MQANAIEPLERFAAVSFIVLAFFALTGHLLFVVLNITHGAFTIAGGILLMNVAFGMFRPKREEHSSHEHEEIAVIPLAFPLTAGPGAITTVILLTAQASNLFETFLVYAAISAAKIVGSSPQFSFEFRLFLVYGHATNWISGHHQKTSN